MYLSYILLHFQLRVVFTKAAQIPLNRLLSYSPQKISAQIPSLSDRCFCGLNSDQVFWTLII